MSWILLYRFGFVGNLGVRREKNSGEMKPSRIKCEIAGNSQRRSILDSNSRCFSVFGDCLEPGLMGDVYALRKILES
ncbi:hypothetical protein M5D96_004578 [Drosophila gunungcola]|uniref:Uncharacterized protein n=1 Tax=Drosophila gunungcola TaxID=103775 RepID=A0A9Q0BT66_9MUSC|nr:hypothetical protein M5D96_004578 [Drosophila gunungcola]